ncbi:MAG: hypothetical protein C0418_02455 [Coriobacteriaceae bacterium]|nr:hypothetical protein [Coriobacteriaceae bacterium]
MSALGETLANERRRAGRTIGDVEQATRIRGGLLAALEKGEYDRLPSSPAYVRGYITSIAKYLEIAPEPLLKLYEQDTRHRPGMESQRIRLPEPEHPTSADVHVIPVRGALLIAIVVALIVLAVWGIGKLVSGPKEPARLPLPAGSATSTPEAGAALATEPAAGEDAQPAGEPTALTPFTLRVAIAEGQASWLRVTVDGLKAYEGTMEDGESREWRITDSATVRMGRPSAVSVYRDGEKITDVPKGEIPTYQLSALPPD